MQDKAGILMLAIGHPYYARLAHNLLASLRYHDPFIQVAIAYSGEGFGMLDEAQKSDFNHVIPIDSYPDVFRTKLDLDLITPFDKTLYLDVDMIWNNFKTPQSLFDELNGTSFTIINHGLINSDNKPEGYWMDMKQVEEKYGHSSLWHISSELIYWEGETEVFATARFIYDTIGVDVKQFGAGFPDEAYLSLAMAQLGIDPHIENWHPTYWEPSYFPKQHNQQYIGGYYAMSVGGAFTSLHIRKIYDNLAKHYYYSTGMTGGPFQLMQKSQIIKERRKI
jgi:hypothetical protein